MGAGVVAVGNKIALRSGSDPVAGYERQKLHCCFVLDGGTSAGGWTLQKHFDPLTDR